MASECQGVKPSGLLKIVEREEFTLYYLKVATIAQVIATIASAFFLDIFVDMTSFIVGGGILFTSALVSGTLLAVTILFHRYQSRLTHILKDAEWVRLPTDHGVKELPDSPEPH